MVPVYVHGASGLRVDKGTDISEPEDVPEEAWIPYEGTPADLRNLGFVTDPAGLPDLLAKVGESLGATGCRG